MDASIAMAIQIFPLCRLLCASTNNPKVNWPPDLLLFLFKLEHSNSPTIMREKILLLGSRIVREKKTLALDRARARARAGASGERNEIYLLPAEEGK